MHDYKIKEFQICTKNIYKSINAATRIAEGLPEEIILRPSLFLSVSTFTIVRFNFCPTLTSFSISSKFI